MAQRRGVRLSAVCEICRLRVVIDANYRGDINVMPGIGPDGGYVCSHCMGKIHLLERRPDLQPQFLQDRTTIMTRPPGSGSGSSRPGGAIAAGGTAWKNLPERGPGAASLKDMCTLAAAATTQPMRDLNRMPQDLLVHMVTLLNARLAEAEAENRRLRTFAVAQHRQLAEADKRYPQEIFVERYDIRQPVNPMRLRR